MSLSTEDLALIATAFVCIEKIKQRPKKKINRTKWVKAWLAKRPTYSHVNLIEELRLEPDDFRNYLRMDENTYVELLEAVSPLIRKQDTVMRTAISCHERLSVTLRFLATGRSFQDLKFSALISPQALGEIIPETCHAITTVLRKEYMRFPGSEFDWMQIAETFSTKWNFPQCLGAVDGKHIRIVCPPNSGSYYFNYKGYFSIVLMAIVNADYEFTLVDVGTNGRISDGGVIENTTFYEKLKSNCLHIPTASAVPGCNDVLPFVFIGDEAFALRPDFMKPFNRKDLHYESRIFNYRLSRARNVVENAFGILASRFRIFHTEINLGVPKVEQIVMACCTLHNFLRRKRKNAYLSLQSAQGRSIGDDDTVENTAERNTAFGDLQGGYNRHASETAKKVRNSFMEYFNNGGQVSWQERRVVS